MLVSLNLYLKMYLNETELFLIALELPDPIPRRQERIHQVSNLHKLIQHFENGELLAVSNAPV